MKREEFVANLLRINEIAPQDIRRQHLPSIVEIIEGNPHYSLPGFVRKAVVIFAAECELQPEQNIRLLEKVDNLLNIPGDD